MKNPLRVFFLPLVVCLPTVLLAQTADVGVAKTGPDNAAPNSDVTYTVIVTNSGPVDAANVTLTDSIPAGMTYVSDSQTGTAFNCTNPGAGNNGTVSCNAALLPAGASTTFTFVFRADSVPNGTVVTNTASVSATTPDSNGSNNSSSTDVFVANNSDLTTTKSGPAQALADTDVSYTVTITNNGPDLAMGAQLTDTMPLDMTYVSTTQDSGPPFNCAPPDAFRRIICTANGLPAGETASFTFVFHIPPGTPNGTSFTNVSEVTSGSTDPNPKNNQAFVTTSTPAATASDLAVMKTGPSAAPPDRDVSYTIVVTNAGPDAAVNLLLEDVLPTSEPVPGQTMTFVSLTQSGAPLICTTPAVNATGTITCTAASYPVASSTTLTLTAHIPAASVAGDVFTNVAEIASDNADPAEENNTGTTSTTVSSADLSILKTQVGPSPVTAGTDITYSITVRNDGPDNASNVTWLDTLPSETTFVSFTQNSGPAAICNRPNPGEDGTIACNFPTLGAGQSATFTLTIRAGNTLSITNTASVSADTGDPDTADNESSATTAVTPLADLQVTKTAPATITAGSNFVYSISLTNAGPSDASTVRLLDALPANVTFVSGSQTSGPTFTCTLPTGGTNGTIDCSIATLSPGATATFSFTVNLAASAANGSTVNNTANVTTTTNDPSPASSTAVSTVATAADAGVTKSGPALAQAGTDYTYTITVANTGPSDAVSVSLDDLLPANVTVVSASQTSGPLFTCTFPAAGTTGAIDCDIATLASGATAVFTVVVHLSPAAAEGSTVTNTANVTTATSDANATNNTSSVNTTVGSEADVSITKTGPASVIAGGQLSYVVTVSNAGPANAVNVTLTDVTPNFTVFVSATQNSGAAFTCTTPAPGAAGTITCTAASLPTATSAQFTFVFRSTGGGPIQNTATVSSPNDVTPGNGAAGAATNVSHGEAVPTLSQWSLLLLALGLATIVLARLQ